MSLGRPSLVLLSAKGRAPRNPCFGNTILSSHASSFINFQQVAIAAPHQYRFLATSSSTSKKQRVPLTLYRQLLRWCDDTEVEIPLSIYVPPFGIQPPQVDEVALRSLAEAANKGSDEVVAGVEGSKLRVKPSMFPPNTVIQSHHLTCPIRNSNDARSFFRAIFRLNAGQTNPDAQKQHIAMAFEALKSLNELNQALDDLKRTRNSRMDREHVHYRVGQVVKHNVELWRGVIVGLEKIGNDDSTVTDRTSLTSKAYELKPEDQVRYQVILDAGDAHMHYSKRREPGDMSTASVNGTDLTPVENASLCRIRSTLLSEFFTHFDAESRLFMLCERKAFEYPIDQPEKANIEISSKTKKAANDIVAGIHEWAEGILKIILKESSNQKSSGEHKLLAFLLDKATTLSSGDVISTKDKLYSPSLSTSKLATLHLQQFHNLVTSIQELLWKRRKSIDNEHSIKFGLGDVVNHKFFGFRGVIVAWDPRPVVEVSRWDGLQHIKDPQNYPFYHVIPDQNDCIEAFGRERESRYVCEANLEICPLFRRIIDVDLEPEWELDRSSRTYIPPADLKFKYGGDMKDDGVVERTLELIKDHISRLLVSSRDGTPSGSPHLDQVAVKLSSENLYTLLQSADTMEDAVIISEILKETWKAHVNSDLRWRLDNGLGNLLSGKSDDAMSAFAALVKDDPSYGEAWNKLSTCEFMLGKLEASLESAQKTLDLIPTHYQALNGMGLVHYERSDISLATEHFQKSLDLDPWSPVSSRLATCLDALQSERDSAAAKK